MKPIRLKGKELNAQRNKVFLRDDGKCQKCGRELIPDHPWTAHPERYHMSHKRNKRMYGDGMENLEALCSGCHLVGVHNPKSVKPKEVVK